jgi:HK97 gp10 family phage protein
MAEQFVHVRGLAELDKLLQDLPVKIEKNLTRGAVRAGAMVILPAAQAGIHNVSGKLSASLKVTTSARGGRVVASVKTRSPIAHLVEYGTRAHTITAKGRSGLSVGGLFFQSVQHPGARPHAFMRPALDANAEAAVIAAGEYLRDKLDSKYGLDTADIQIGDEE